MVPARDAPMPKPRTILCMKWGALYAADYANVLFNACRRHLAGPFRFLCLTDRPEGLDPEIEARPIPEIGCTPEMWRHGAWPKLSVFAENLYDLSGRVLFVDLDTVICGDLEPFFAHPAPFVGIDTSDNWRPGGQPGAEGALLGTGVFAFDAGGQAQILSRFQADPAAAFAKAGIEQVWVQEHATSLDYWPQGLVISFKRWLRRPVGLDLFLPPKAPPVGTGMVAFHGEPRPIALIRPGNARWDRLPHLGRGQVGWMRDYWLENGGRLPEAGDRGAGAK